MPKTSSSKSTELVPDTGGQGTAPTVYHVRDHAVVLDADVASLFGYSTSRLNEQVKRNAERFKDDFAFQLTDAEFNAIKSEQPEDAGGGHGGRRTPPWAFTETGVVMAATVLKSEQAVSASIFIVKTFVAASKAKAAAVGSDDRKAISQDTPASLPAPADADAMAARIQSALDRVIDAGTSPRAVKKVGEEGRKLARQAIREGKAHLSKQQNLNDKTRAEIEELIKKAEAIDTDIAGKDIENEHRRLALVAKQLRLALVIERYKQTGDDTALLQVLADLSSA
jgi:hypothetical protein